jgi:hypothetical protein
MRQRVYLPLQRACAASFVQLVQLYSRFRVSTSHGVSVMR